MKKLSDYKDEEVFDLWADLIDSAYPILEDEELQELADNAPVIVVAKHLIKNHRQQLSSILLRIDDTPIDGLNILVRTVSLLNEIGEHPELKAFFGLQGQNEAEESSGSATENTEVKEH